MAESSAKQDLHGKVVSGETWDEFCDALKRAGRQILRPEAPADAFNRAEGWRYLTRLLRIGLEMHLEYADPQFPGFFAPSHETGKIGADNPDNLYLMARLDGRNDYIVRGQRGTVSYLSFGTQKGGYESNGRMEQTGFGDAKDFHIAADGSFEVILSRTQRPGNWVRLEPESNALIVRQTFLDRRMEKPAQLAIQRLDTKAKPEPLDPAQLHQSLMRTAAFVEGTSRVFADWAQSYLPKANQLPPADQALCQASGGDPNIYYYHSYWELADDKALVVHLDRIPQCRFWNLQVNNWWMESLDYRYHRICINKHSAQTDANGGVTLVLAHRDPGVPNWLETAGHRQGTLCFRWVEATEHVHPTTRVVPFTDISRVISR